MRFEVDPTSSTSVYLQVCEQVKYAVATGVLAPGDRLPTIRQVAAETRVNRNTIARAYSELERSGVIVSRPGQGSFVAPSATAIQKRERLRILEEMVRKLLV
ncbi:MAG: GntR family transcriptional regulator, partial [Acidobacteriota bacterium]